jgi:hypothetical protein
MDIMDTEPCVESPPTGIAKESQTESNLASTSVPGSTLSSEASPAAPNTDAPEDGAGHRADLPTIEPMELPTQNPERHTTPLSASGSRPMTPNQPAVIGGLSPPSQVMPNAIVLRNPVVEAQHATSFRFAPRQIGSSAPISKSRPHLWRPKIAVKITAPYLNGPRPPVSNETDFGILMLTNPSLELPCTTDTLQARLHFIRPWGADEVRRHTASSLRFVIRGNGGSTMINEQIIEMRPHDVIVTPRWAWHNTFVSTQDKECVIFLDVLDVPAFQHFPGQFIEHRTAQPTSSDRHEDETTQLVYLWTVMKAALDTTPDVWASREYKTNSGSQRKLGIILSSQQAPANLSRSHRHSESMCGANYPGNAIPMAYGIMFQRISCYFW